MVGSSRTSSDDDAGPPYRRVVLKVTGESFAPVGTIGLDLGYLDQLAEKIVSAARMGVQIAVVVGGGNLMRGANLAGSKLVRPVAAHQMGMIATVINGSALAEALHAKGQGAVLTCSMPVGNFTQYYCPQRAQDDLEAGRIVILTGGTGNAFVTTDTCAAIRAAELQADALLKATKVDGVYTADPVKHPDAKRYERLTAAEAIEKNLGVMDLPAVAICRQARVPILVFNYQENDSIAGVLAGRVKATQITAQ